MANSEEPDQMPRFAKSDLSLHSLLKPVKHGDDRFFSGLLFVLCFLYFLFFF